MYATHLHPVQCAELKDALGEDATGVIKQRFRKSLKQKNKSKSSTPPEGEKVEDLLTWIITETEISKEDKTSNSKLQNFKFNFRDGRSIIIRKGIPKGSYQSVLDHAKKLISGDSEGAGKVVDQKSIAAVTVCLHLNWQYEWLDPTNSKLLACMQVLRMVMRARKVVGTALHLPKLP